MPDPRLHGPETCPVAPAGCEACSGHHHWLEDSADPEADWEPDDVHARAVVAYDREHGTDHCLAFYGCKHCDAWAEAEYIWEIEEAEEDAPDAHEVIRCWCGAEGTAAQLFDPAVYRSGPCGGLGTLHCECGGDLCVCHNHGEVECPGCEDCEPDRDFDDEWEDDDAD